MHPLHTAVLSPSADWSLALRLIPALVLVLGSLLLVAIARRLRAQDKELASLRRLLGQRSSGLDSVDQELRKLMTPDAAESVSALQVAHELRPGKMVAAYRATRPTRMSLCESCPPPEGRPEYSRACSEDRER